MAGGLGNDTYFVNNSNDVVTEANGEGTIRHRLYQCRLHSRGELRGRDPAGQKAAGGHKITGNQFSHNLVGDAGNDTLTGGTGNDTLNGGTGTDTMAGGAGNDTYFVDNANDVVNETAGQGSDTIWAGVNYSLSAGSEIEFLRANAGATGLSLTGNALANTVMGGTGNDTLDGGAGNDTLFGGTGNDVFKFLAGFGQDTISDFTAGPVGSQDLMDISGLGITAATFAASVQIASLGLGHESHDRRQFDQPPWRWPGKHQSPTSSSPETRPRPLVQPRHQRAKAKDDIFAGRTA